MENKEPIKICKQVANKEKYKCNVQRALKENDCFNAFSVKDGRSYMSKIVIVAETDCFCFYY